MIGVDRGRWADGLQVGSSLLWVAQSALIAVLLQRLSQGAGADAVWGRRSGSWRSPPRGPGSWPAPGAGAFAPRAG